MNAHDSLVNMVAMDTRFNPALLAYYNLYYSNFLVLLLQLLNKLMTSYFWEGGINRRCPNSRLHVYRGDLIPLISIQHVIKTA